jgi:hypothetical protein
LTNLFDINRILAVKLNQSLNSLYALPYYEYCHYLDSILEETGINSNQQFEIQPTDELGQQPGSA